MIADKWTAKNEEAECADNDPEHSGAIDVDHLRDIWNRLPFLKHPRNEEELEALMDFSEDLYEAIEGAPSHPLHSLYKVAETLFSTTKRGTLPRPNPIRSAA